MTNEKDRTVPAGKLDAWLATAAPGHCPCGNSLEGRKRGANGEVRLCAEPACRARYVELYRQDRRGESYLRDVTRVEPIPERPRHRRVHFSCEHTEDLPQSVAKLIGVRRRCPTCATQGAASAPGR